jgi:AcrR family transcriptional regulator
VKALTFQSMAKRAYEQRLRAEAAEANRRRILDTLYERLREAPAEPITIDEIARRGRVARSTIYLAFGSRSGLFDALTDHLLTGAGYDRIVDAVRHPDARESLRGALAGGVEQYAAHHDVLRVLASMGKLDPEGVGQAIARGEGLRSRGVARLARRLHEQGHLRADLTVPRATAVIWLLAGFDAYDALATGQGLAPSKIAEILIGTAENTLLAQP